MKKQIFTLLSVCLVSNVFAGADLRSTVNGITIENTHLLYQGKNGSEVLRGSAPNNKVKELSNYGITDVIIFKNQTTTEVDLEIAALDKVGIDHLHIPFLWKNIKNPIESCQHIVQALKKIKKEISKENQKVFFHCTVGQDRTGLLAGLFEMLNDGKTKRDVFENQMCAHGYEASAESKPAHVVKTIRDELTPTFLKMAKYIEDKNLNLKTISPSMCPKAIKAELTEDLKNWQCSR